jgi:hypothetical protein
MTNTHVLEQICGESRRSQEVESKFLMKDIYFKRNGLTIYLISDEVLVIVLS